MINHQCLIVSSQPAGIKRSDQSPAVISTIDSVDELQLEEEAVRALKVWQWRSIGLSVTAGAGGGRGASLYSANADILPQETIANLNGKQQGCYYECCCHFGVQECSHGSPCASLSLSLFNVESEMSQNRNPSDVPAVFVAGSMEADGSADVHVELEFDSGDPYAEPAGASWGCGFKSRTSAELFLRMHNT